MNVSGLGGGTPYARLQCFICGAMISGAGFAQYSHKMKHVREGRLRTIVDQDQRVRFEMSLREALAREGS